MASTHGLDSWQYFQQAIGKPSRGMVSNRVITIGLCEKHHAFEMSYGQERSGQKSTSLTRPTAVATAVLAENVSLERTRMAIRFLPLELRNNSHPVDCGQEPEDQIAEFVFNRHKSLNIPADHMGYDSFGRGTLGFSFAKMFGSSCPVPIDSGAQTTERPVRFDLYVEEQNGEKRLKLARSITKVHN